MVSSKRVYGVVTPFVSVFPDPITRNAAPTVNDKNYPNGFVWIYRNGDVRTQYTYGGLDSSGDAVWILAGPGASDVDTLTGDGGGAIAPAAGNITLAGGTNITTAGAANTITFNMDAAITLATSVTAPLFTAAAADAVVQAGGANDVVLRLGDNAGATFLRIQDSDSADQVTIDSDGAMSGLTGLTVAGAAISLNDDSNFNTSINTGTSTGTVTIGSANAGIIDIGSGAAITIDTAAGVSIDGATASNFTVTGAAEDLTLGATGGSINMVATEADAQAILIDASDAAGGIDVDCGTGGFDLLATGGAFSIDGQAASNITVTSAGLDLSLEGVGCAVVMSSTETENDAIDIHASAANGGIQMRAGTGGIRMGDEADCTGITMGNIAPTASRNITIGSGTVVTAAVTDDISIGDGGATTNADSIKHVDINNGGVTTGVVRTYINGGAVTSGTHLLELSAGNVAAGTATINMSTGTGTKTVNIGNADANTTLNIDAITAINTDVNAAVTINTGTSTGAITLGAIANSGAVAIESSSTIDVDAAGAVSLNSTGAAINIGNDANAFAINIGTGAAARTVTIGNATGASSVVVDVGTGAASFGASATAHTTTIGGTTGASATVIQAGTGEITMTGTVKQIDAELMGQSGIYVPTFTQDAPAVSAANTGGVPTGATGNVNLYTLQGGFVMQGFVVGAGQTILQPIMGANGLIINADQTDTEGMEYNFPYFQYTIGTSDAFAFELDLYINDMDGAAPYVFGFRKTEANNADWTAYDTVASMGMIAASSVTNVVLATELNGGGQTITDTTDAWGGDGTTNTLRVLVDASGNVTYTINGAAPSATAAFQIDNADVVIPFIRIGHNANATDVAITGMRIGFQA